MKPRRALSDGDKRFVLTKYGGRCPGLPALAISCGRSFTKFVRPIFDHIGQRSITRDDSRDNYQPLCATCNDIKTNGPGGERRITTAGSDAGIRKKDRRMKRKWRAHRRKMRRKGRF